MCNPNVHTPQFIFARVIKLNTGSKKVLLLIIKMNKESLKNSQYEEMMLEYYKHAFQDYIIYDE